MEMMLQTQNLCKYFRKQKAVNNVSLNIEKKQIYGLLGPNGAGKSTTLKMLTGMMKPTAGKIYFDGKLLDRKDLSKIGGECWTASTPCCSRRRSSSSICFLLCNCNPKLSYENK